MYHNYEPLICDGNVKAFILYDLFQGFIMFVLVFCTMLQNIERHFSIYNSYKAHLIKAEFSYCMPSQQSSKHNVP